MFRVSYTSSNLSKKKPPNAPTHIHNSNNNNNKPDPKPISNDKDNNSSENSSVNNQSKSSSFAKATAASSAKKKEGVNASDASSVSTASSATRRPSSSASKSTKNTVAATAVAADPQLLLQKHFPQNENFVSVYSERDYHREEKPRRSVESVATAASTSSSLATSISSIRPVPQSENDSVPDDGSSIQNAADAERNLNHSKRHWKHHGEVNQQNEDERDDEETQLEPQKLTASQVNNSNGLNQSGSPIQYPRKQAPIPMSVVSSVAASSLTKKLSPLRARIHQSAVFSTNRLRHGNADDDDDDDILSALSTDESHRRLLSSSSHHNTSIASTVSENNDSSVGSIRQHHPLTQVAMLVYKRNVFGKMIRKCGIHRAHRFADLLLLHHQQTTTRLRCFRHWRMRLIQHRLKRVVTHERKKVLAKSLRLWKYRYQLEATSKTLQQHLEIKHETNLPSKIFQIWRSKTLAMRRAPLVRVVFNKWKMKTFTNIVVSKLVDSLVKRCWTKWRRRVVNRENQGFALQIERRVVLWKTFLKWREEMDRRRRVVVELNLKDSFMKKKWFSRWKTRFQDRVAARRNKLDSYLREDRYYQEKRTRERDRGSSTTGLLSSNDDDEDDDSFEDEEDESEYENARHRVSSMNVRGGRWSPSQLL